MTDYPNATDYANKAEREAAYWREQADKLAGHLACLLVEREMGSIVTLADDPIDSVLSALNGDSLHRISLLMEIEDEFGVEISDDEDEALGPDATLRSVLGLIERKLAAKVAA